MPPLLILATFAALGYQIACAVRPEGSQSWVGSAVKTVSVAALAAQGVLSGAPGLIIAGLALGALGDFALSRPGKAAFLAGMAAFAAGHIGYTAYFWQHMTPLSPWHFGAFGILLALLASTEVWLAPRTGDLRAPVRLYGVIIAAMAATALALPPGLHLLTLGAALFLGSDVLLALRLFVVKSPRAQSVLGYLLWPAYWLGQTLILTGAPLHG